MIKITPEIEQEVSRFNTSEELLRSGGISIAALDRAAYGFDAEDIKTLMPNQLHIKWRDDYSSVLWEVQKSGLSKRAWAKKINLSEPIDVSYEKNKFYIEDGHHRYYAAKVLNKPLNVNLEINQNPITTLAPKLSYDEFHREVFNQVKGNVMNEAIKKDNFNSKVFYHGRTKTRPYNGNYIFLTDDIGYAVGYSDDLKIMEYSIPFPEDRIFSIRNPKHLRMLSKYLDAYTIQSIIRDSGQGNELDWAALSYISTDDYEDASELFKHMGFYGVRLRERPETNSIYIFDESKLVYIGTIDLNTDLEKRQKVIDYFKDFQNKYIQEIINEEIDNNLNNFYLQNNINPDELNYLGAGDFGKAYSTGDGRVLKITTSKSEFEIAKELVGKNDYGVLDGIVDVYVAEVIDGKMMIIMEELSEDYMIEDLYYQLEDLLSEQNLPIQYLNYLDTDNLEISNELQSFMLDIEDINSGYRYLGIEASDIKPDNMGRDKNGKIKAFDLDDKSRNRLNEIINEEIEDYHGEHEAPDRESGSPMHDPTGAFGDDIYKPEALRYFGNGNSFDVYSLNVIRSVKGRPNKMVTVYRSLPDINFELNKKRKYYYEMISYINKYGFPPMKDTGDARDIHRDLGYNKEATLDKLFEIIRGLNLQLEKPLRINAGDWVTPALEYAREHGRNNLHKFKIVQKTVPARTLFTDAGDLNEWGYDPT